MCGVNKNYLYILLITDSVTGLMHYSIDGHINQLSFGILTSALLPHQKVSAKKIWEFDEVKCVCVCVLGGKEGGRSDIIVT